ncbi:MAG: XdhC family protein [Pseudomonadota bacterium]
MKGDALRALNVARGSRQAALLVTNLETGDQGLFLRGDDIAQGEIAEQAQQRFRSGKSGIAQVEGQDCFFNVHVPAPRLVIIGAVHISQTLAPLAEQAGFDVMVVDPRTAFATPERFASIDVRAEWPSDIEDTLALDPYTALAALTHDPKIDDFPLTKALDVGCFYVGALGSRKTHAKRKGRLIANGVDEASFDRIHAPIGLDVGAANPPEIAVAVMAEIIAALRKSDIG